MDSSTLVETVILGTIQTFQRTPDDLQECWNAFLFGEGVLKKIDPDTLVEALMGFLTNENPKLVALSILYLGISRDEFGIDATKAIEPIRSAMKSRITNRPIVSAGGVALSMLGDIHAVEDMTKAMKKHNMNTTTEYFSQAVQQVVKSIVEA